MIKLNVKNPVLKKQVHYMTSDYKTRNSNRSSHNGIDLIGASYGVDDVIAIEKGRVKELGYNTSMGYYVALYHGECTSYYLHLKKGSIKVKIGEVVEKGKTLGTMGMTGNATGNHLHFAVKKTGYTDPLPYLNTAGIFKTNRIKELQKALNKYSNYKLSVDGIFGTKSRDALRKSYVKIGDRKELVTLLQSHLNKIGYDIGIDGIFGPNTEKAVRDFQKSKKLINDGYAGYYTFVNLLEI